MSDLKTLRVRIRSVKSTQKITKAMKVVSAAKLRGVRNAAERSAPYARLMRKIMKEIVSNVDKNDLPPLMSGRSERNRLIVVISGDRGLCGGFNSYIIKAAAAEIEAAKRDNVGYQLLFIGKKAYALLQSQHNDAISGAHFGIANKKHIPFSDAERVAGEIIEKFEKGDVDSCRIVYTEFVNALIQKVHVSRLIPMCDGEEGDVTVPGETQDISAPQGLKALYTFEPDKEKLLNDIVPRNIAVQLYHAILESAASEHAARMTAMDNASRNASDMVSRLTLQYNRSRQAAITTELIEVISGAESV